MRRTQANQLALRYGPAPIVLADLECCVCSTVGTTIWAAGRNSNGAIERCYCGVDCATREGWPFIVEKR